MSEQTQASQISSKHLCIEPVGAARRRGSLLILVVTVLVIIALLGIAFLQRVRMDQFATARYEREYIDLVINATMSEIGTQMRNDIFENRKDRRPLYDYPYTDGKKEFEAWTEYPTPTRFMTNGTSSESAEDDKWLASTAPIYDLVPDDYTWMHLTNLTGVWLELPDLGSTINLPREFPINGAMGSYNRSDTSINLTDLQSVNGGYQKTGVDTDLDGVLDARWQWAARDVRSLGGRKFVIALRIVDLSSMLNVNTASEASQPRGWSPAEVNLARFLSKTNLQGLDSIDLGKEMDSILERRATNAGLPGINSITLSTSQLRDLWLDQASRYGYIDKRNYLIGSEMELRNRGGLNKLSQVSQLEFFQEAFTPPASPPPPTGLYKLLRQDPLINSYMGSGTGSESTFVDVVGGPTPPALPDKASFSRWFYGSTDPSTPTTTEIDTNNYPLQNRQFRAIRHMLTTQSGHTIYAPDYASGASKNFPLYKFSLNREDKWDNLNDTEKEDLLEDLSEQIERVLMVGDDVNERYQNLTATDIGKLADEYAVAIADYSDQDNEPSEITVGGTSYYGLEKLPFLREAYFHQLYEAVDRLAADGNPPDPTIPTNLDGQLDTWIPKTGGTQGIVVELGNPFSHKIDGNKLTPRIRIAIEHGVGNVVSWWDPVTDGPDLLDIDPRDDTTTTDPDDVLIFIKNQSAAGDGQNIGTNLNLSGLNNVITSLDSTVLDINTGTDINVVLQVDVDGQWVTYDRMRTNEQFESEYRIETGDWAVVIPDQYRQISVWRNCNEINYISTGSGRGDFARSPDASAVQDFSAQQHNFGDDGKSPTTPGTLLPPELQLPHADRSMRSVAELAWVHLFGFTNNETFTERMASPPPHTDGRDFLVLQDATDPNFVVLSDSGLPHAALMMDAFTAISPRYDGVDNDGNLVSDNTEERFIPGTININTAPLHIAALGAPMPESLADTERMMRTIIAYRDQPTRVMAGHQMDDPILPFSARNVRALVLDNPAPNKGVDPGARPGIASLGELAYINPGVSNPYNMNYMGVDGNPLPLNYDLYPNPDVVAKPGNLANDEDYGDDNEHWLARFQTLSQSYSVRSDRFLVYGVVNGYRDRLFNMQPVESAIFIAVIDRGAMKSDKDLPNVIGFTRLK